MSEVAIIGLGLIGIEMASLFKHTSVDDMHF
jgi:pyruvate/2-oxoglutarate dehydrogenase complex dihydrolipoamide dehydrogenase (E3) component